MQNSQYQPKLPKGTLDSNPFQMNVFDCAKSIIVQQFKKHSACQIDTPVFELKETLLGKYGEDQKLIYDLQDQGGEDLSLRYDLTVPFARYMATNGIQSIKRYHIAKVYRRDQPNMTCKRLREFYQCDFDIAGEYDSMVPDAEVIKVFAEILIELDLGIPFKIKLNSRKILDAIIQISGAPVEKFKQICSSIDKLDKNTLEEVKQELIEKKQIDKDVVERISKFVIIKGEPLEVLKQIKSEQLFQNSDLAKQSLEEMETLFTYLQEMNVLQFCSFDLSLARGLDYYTGLIFEAVLEGSEVGSIAGGGRYDDLIGMFSKKKIPSVGGSLGISRILGILEKKFSNKSSIIRNNESLVLVANIGKEQQIEKVRVANKIWAKNIPCEISYDQDPKLGKQFKFANKNQIPFVILIGQDEVAKQVVKCKCTYKQEEEYVPRDNVVEYLEEKIKQYWVDLKNQQVNFNNE